MAEGNQRDAGQGIGSADVMSAIVASFSFAVALPLLSLLGRNPEFFVAHGFSPLDYFSFAFGLAIGIPLVLVGVVLAVPWTRIRTLMLFAIVGFLLGLIGLQVLKQLPMTGAVPAWAHVVVSVGLAVGGVVAIWRWSGVRTFLRVCSVVPVVLIPLFLFADPVEAARSTPEVANDNMSIANPIPVVFVVFDELPLTSLLRTDGTINEERFPNFARLAEHTTWFTNAFANSASTTESVPSLLSGRYPDSSRSVPVTSDYPNNLFTLVGSQYSVVGGESVTRLCPEDICLDTRPLASRWQSLPSDVWYVFLHLSLPASMTESLPPIDEDWANFGVGYGSEVNGSLGKESEEAADSEVSDAIDLDDPVTVALLNDRSRSFDRFVTSIAAAEQSTLYFHHSLVPHRPWQYLPSGQVYEAHPRVPGTDQSTWTDVEFLVDQGFQRHLLQVGMADRQLGQLLDQLEGQGLIDEALIVVTSDHGITFRPGEPMRAPLGDRLGSVGAVPLFVSLDPAWDGRTVDTPVELVDILPTVASTLEVDVDWEFDGTPLQTTLRGGDEGREILTFPGPVAHHDVGQSHREVTRELSARYELDGGWGRLLKPSLGFDLVGRALDEVEVGAPLEWTVVVETLDDLDAVDLASETLPVMMEGWIDEGGEDGSGFSMALALNGTISAVFETFDQARGDMISVLIPSNDLRDGQNRLELFLIQGSGARLRPIPDVRGTG